MRLRVTGTWFVVSGCVDAAVLFMLRNCEGRAPAARPATGRGEVLWCGDRRCYEGPVEVLRTEMLVLFVRIGAVRAISPPSDTSAPNFDLGFGGGQELDGHAGNGVRKYRGDLVGPRDDGLRRAPFLWRGPLGRRHHQTPEKLRR